MFDTTGSYSLVWYLGILLGLGSAAIHLPIKELPARKFQRCADLDSIASVTSC